MILPRTYILPRIVQLAVVILVGITETFQIPRLSPVSPGVVKQRYLRCCWEPLSRR